MITSGKADSIGEVSISLESRNKKETYKMRGLARPHYGKNKSQFIKPSAIIAFRRSFPSFCACARTFNNNLSLPCDLIPTAILRHYTIRLPAPTQQLHRAKHCTKCLRRTTRSRGGESRSNHKIWEAFKSTMHITQPQHRDHSISQTSLTTIGSGQYHLLEGVGISNEKFKTGRLSDSKFSSYLANLLR